jgi:hypothetical protein
MISVIKINDNAAFETTAGISLGINQIYLALAPRLPFSSVNRGLLQGENSRVKFRVFTNDSFEEELKDVRYLTSYNDLSLSSIVVSPETYWTDVNAGAVFDEVIRELERRNENWIGKITKELV